MGTRVYLGPWVRSLSGNVNFAGEVEQAAEPASNVYLTPPTAADPMDDEFKTGPSSLAQRGWTVVHPTNGQTMVRVGDVTQGPPGISSTQYRSTLTPSGLLMQGSFIAHKAWSGSGALYAHMEQLMPGASTTQYFEGPTLWNPVLQSNATRKLLVNAYNGGRGFSKMDLNQTYTVFGQMTMTADSAPWGAYISWDDTAKLATGWCVDPWRERLYFDASGGGQSFPTFAPLAAGFAVTCPSAANAWVCIRTFRRYPLGKWPGIV